MKLVIISVGRDTYYVDVSAASSVRLCGIAYGEVCLKAAAAKVNAVHLGRVMVHRLQRMYPGSLCVHAA